MAFGKTGVPPEMEVTTAPGQKPKQPPKQQPPKQPMQGVGIPGRSPGRPVGTGGKKGAGRPVGSGGGMSGMPPQLTAGADDDGDEGAPPASPEQAMASQILKRLGARDMKKR